MFSQRRQRAYIAVTAFLAVLMAASAILPSLTNNTVQNQPQVQPTEVPIPTFPPPIEELGSINFDQKYLHPSGLFTVAQPTGWLPSTDSNNGVFVQVNFNNDTAKSIIETYVEYPAETLETLEALNSHFTTSALEDSWRNYTDAAETGRFIDEENDRVLIDFELTLGRQTYLARHVAQIVNGDIYVTRVVTPDNARDLLLYLVDQMPLTIQPVTIYGEVPAQEVEWTSYYSAVDGMIVRYPNGWSIVDGGDGEPVSIEGNDGETMRVEKIAGAAVADESAASAYVEALRPGTEILSVEPVTRNGAEGFAVSYQFATLEGENQNGLAVLLNGAEDALYIANVRAPGQATDLNNLPEDAGLLFTNLAGAASTFNLTDGLELPTIADEGVAS